MCVRISISFARVASSIAALAAAPPRFVPDVPVGLGVAVLPAPADSLPASFVMMPSIAATSVPQLLALADAVADPRWLVLFSDAPDAAGLSSAVR